MALRENWRGWLIVKVLIVATVFLSIVLLLRSIGG
jgi:hypothetical protein